MEKFQIDKATQAAIVNYGEKSCCGDQEMKFPYHEAVGFFLYLSNKSMPNILVAVSYCVEIYKMQQKW